MSRQLIFLYLFLFIPIALCTASEVKKERDFDLSKCEEKSGKDYWYENIRQEFTDNFKVLDKSESITYWSSSENNCFFTSTEEISDKNKQFHGYSRYLIKHYFFFHTEDPNDTTRKILTKLNKISDKNFESIDDFIIWHYSTSNESRIEDFKETDARSYWYYEYPGFLNLNFVKDGQFQWCYYKSIYVLSCKRIDLTDIKDAEPRTEAYIQRIEWDIGQFECGASEKYLKTAKKYNSIFPENFSSFDEFHKWWYENREYIYWSNKKEKFLVDIISKNNMRPLRNFKIDVNSDQDIGARTYWSNLIRHEGYKTIRDMDDFLRVCGMSAHQSFSFTVSKSYAENFNNKENGYKNFLESTIEFLSRNPEYKYPKSPEEVYFPEHMLDQKFDTVKELVDWYNENKDNLVLSEDGEKLVIKEPSD